MPPYIPLHPVSTPLDQNPERNPEWRIYVYTYPLSSYFFPGRLDVSYMALLCSLFITDTVWRKTFMVENIDELGLGKF